MAKKDPSISGIFKARVLSGETTDGEAIIFM
jgi:hypothetical protein